MAGSGLGNSSCGTPGGGRRGPIWSLSRSHSWHASASRPRRRSTSAWRSPRSVPEGRPSGLMLRAPLPARAGAARAASAGDMAGAGDMMVQQIAQVDSRYMIGGTNWVGLAVPLHCSALGKVLLAFGAARMPAGPLEAQDVPHHHLAGGTRGRACRGPRARLRRHRRGTRARAGRRRRAGLRRRAVGDRRGLRLGACGPAHRRPDPRDGGRLRQRRRRPLGHARRDLRPAARP